MNRHKIQGRIPTHGRDFQRPELAEGMPTVRSNPFDPPSELRRYRENEPLCRLSYPDGHVGWLVTSYELAKAVMVDPRFSSRLDLLRFPVPRPKAKGFTDGEPLPGFFGVMDPPEHTRYRRLLMGQFTVRRMNQLQPQIEKIVEDHLDAMEEAGPPLDLVQSFALPIPSSVICEFLGVPYADREEFQRNSVTLLSLDADDETASNALQALSDFFVDLIQRKRSNPGGDLLSELIGSGAVSNEELVGIGMLLLVAGHETTANMLGLGTFALLCHPEQADAVRCGRASVENTVEELVRYITIAQLTTMRTALEDVELGGLLINAGDSVTVSLPAANRDPARFDDPDTLDLSRDVSGHLAFGHGIHQCLGQQLARIEMRTGFPKLFRRFPTLRLAVTPEKVPLGEDMAIYGLHQLPVVW